MILNFDKIRIDFLLETASFGHYFLAMILSRLCALDDIIEHDDISAQCVDRILHFINICR